MPGEATTVESVATLMHDRTTSHVRVVDGDRAR